VTDGYRPGTVGILALVSTFVDVARAQALLERGAQLVDVLPQSVYEKVHIPGAVNVPLETLEPDDGVAGLDKGRALLVYCYDQH
jgi:rhodanese-related sulfurtransferase